MAERRAATSTSVLDASALMALLHGEDGADMVIEAMVAGTAISLVNVAEVLSKFAELGEDPEDVRRQLQAASAEEAGDALVIEPLTADDCVVIARLRPRTRGLGLSLADRACLALAARLGVPALTADRMWVEADVGVEVRLIR